MTSSKFSCLSLRILVVEDDDDLRDLMIALLQQIGHHADGASDGPAALESVQADVFDVLLLDLDLPGLSGLEVARLLVASPDVPA